MNKNQDGVGFPYKIGDPRVRIFVRAKSKFCGNADAVEVAT